MGLGTLFFLGALVVEVRAPDNADSSEWLRFADGTEVMVMALVTKEATLQEDGPGSLRQRKEVETEQITRGDENLAVSSGLRITIYQQELKRDSDQEARASAQRSFCPAG